MAPPRTRRKVSEAESVTSTRDDDEMTALVEEIGRDARGSTTRRGRGRKRPAKAILDEFSSLDALLSADSAEQQRKAQQESKLQKLKEEAKRAKRGEFDASAPLARMVQDMEANLASLDAESVWFMDAKPSDPEKFGFVFTPITSPLKSPAFKATPSELKSTLGLVYKAMQTTKETELGELLWSKVILVRVLLDEREIHRAIQVSSSVTMQMMVPERICTWFFTTMSTHLNSHIVKGCLSNLLLMVAASSERDSMTDLFAGLACCRFAHDLETFRVGTNGSIPDFRMEWHPSVYDFLNAFRRFGFQDSKRSMSTKSRITPTAKKAAGRPAVPFPTLNMQCVLSFLVLVLRTRLLKLDGFDALSFTLFFLRMQFEQQLHGEIVQLASVCIEELLEVFPLHEWRKEWAPSLVLRIAGVKEGLFNSAAGWLSVARRLPRTNRGTQLTTALAIYVLQYRVVDRTEDSTKAASEPPLKFPIQSGITLDIVAGIVDSMTAKYLATKQDDTAKAVPPPFELLGIKVALIDLALQAFLNVLTHKEMSIMLGKLDELTEAHKATMSAKWHELKTVVSLMHRKYASENLRVGRTSSPSAKTALFVDDDSD